MKELKIVFGTCIAIIICMSLGMAYYLWVDGMFRAMSFLFVGTAGFGMLCLYFIINDKDSL